MIKKSHSRNPRSRRPRHKREDLMKMNNAVEAATTTGRTWGFIPVPCKHMGLNARIFEKKPEQPAEA